MKRESDTLNEIMDEVRRARNLFPTWPTDPVHQAAIVAEQAGSLLRSCMNAHHLKDPKSRGHSLKHARKEAIQTAAMAIRFVEKA